MQITFFHTAGMLNKNTKVHVKSFKTVAFKGLRTAFYNSFLSLELALRVVSENTNNVFHRAGMLKKIPKVHVKSLKTVDARASGLHFTTPS